MEISPLIKDHYRLKNTEPRVVILCGSNKKVDLRTITKEEADELHASGKFHYLEKIEKPSPPIKTRDAKAANDEPKASEKT